MMKPPRRKWKRYVVLLFLPVVMSYGGLKIYQTRQQRQKFEAEFTQFEQGGGGWTRVSINGITPPHVRTRSFVNDVGTRVSTAFEDKYNLSGWLGKKWVDEIFYGEFNAVSLSSDAELEKLSHLVELSKITSIDLSSPKVTSKSFQLMLEKTPKVKLLKIRHAYLNEAELASLFQLQELEGLLLHNVPIADSDLLTLSKIKHLQGLDLTYTDLLVRDLKDLPSHVEEPYVLEETLVNEGAGPQKRGPADLRVVQSPHSKLILVPARRLCRVTPEGLERFKAARPDCQLFYECYDGE